VTLIAFATSRNRADILTDTWRYTHLAEAVDRSTKVHPLHHLDAIWMSQGDCFFAQRWALLVGDIGGTVVDFDELVDVAPEYVQALWQNHLQEWPKTGDFVLFLVGFSTKEGGRFTAYQLAADFDFKLQRIDEPFAIPASPSYRMSNVEAHRLQRVIAEAAQPIPESAAYLDAWMEKPAMPAPPSAAEWLRLGTHLRETRAEIETGSLFKVLIGGDLWHTVIRQGEVTSRRVHTFNDHGEGYMRMLAGTLNPVGQLQPCWCGSGEKYIRCHLVPYLDQPCECGSGRMLRDCCIELADTSTDPGQDVMHDEGEEINR
jgi:SEC-C motif